MRKQFISGLIIALPVLFTACEKVIDIPLEEAERRLVVEGVLKDEPGSNYILLSKTGSVYQEADFEKISGATVTVTDKSGTVYPFAEVSGIPGLYAHPTFAAQPDNFYTLSLTAAGETVNATCETFYTPKLDSLTYIEQVGTFGVGEDTTYLVFFNFSDNGAQDNFYRINAWVNGEKQEVFYVTYDELFNGQTYTQPIYASTVEKGDTVLIELLSMDQANYTYFYSLQTTQTEGPFSPTPANPVSNLEGNAIGYFGAYTTDTLSIIIPQ